MNDNIKVGGIADIVELTSDQVQVAVIAKLVARGWHVL